jgi:hypothetical protein
VPPLDLNLPQEEEPELDGFESARRKKVGSFRYEPDAQEAPPELPEEEEMRIVGLTQAPPQQDLVAEEGFPRA